MPTAPAKFKHAQLGSRKDWHARATRIQEINTKLAEHHATMSTDLKAALDALTEIRRLAQGQRRRFMLPAYRRLADIFDIADPFLSGPKATDPLAQDDAISARTLKQLDESAENMKQGRASDIVQP